MIYDPPKPNTHGPFYTTATTERTQPAPRHRLVCRRIYTHVRSHSGLKWWRNSDAVKTMRRTKRPQKQKPHHNQPTARVSPHRKPFCTGDLATAGAGLIPELQDSRINTSGFCSGFTTNVVHMTASHLQRG